MTTADCNHFTVDESAYCGQCQDEWYLDTPFDMNGHAYTVWQFYGNDYVTGEASYQCRRQDGNGTITLNTGTLDTVIG